MRMVAARYLFGIMSVRARATRRGRVDTWHHDVWFGSRQSTHVLVTRWIILSLREVWEGRRGIVVDLEVLLHGSQ